MAWKGDSTWADPLANPPGACNSKQAFRPPYQGKETFFTQTLWGAKAYILGGGTTPISAMYKQTCMRYKGGCLRTLPETDKGTGDPTSLQHTTTHYNT